VEEALGRDSHCVSALYMRAHLQYRGGKLQEAESGLRALLQRTLLPELKVRAWYELGAVLDREERYDEAMESFLAAKTLLTAEGAPLYAARKALAVRVGRVTEETSADILRRWYDFGRELQPARRVALLGGHPRSGTTLLEQVLDSHPQIVSAEETNHFQDHVGMPLERPWPQGTPLVRMLDATSKETLVARRNEYFRATELCLGSPLGDRLLIDKNPSLTLWPSQLARVFPEMKFLIALRDPRDVVLSCFMQPMIPVQHVGATWLRLDTAVDEYAFVMGTWRAFAPKLPNPHLEVRYEDMVQDLESVARPVLEFLGVPWDDRVLGFDEHARRKLVRSPTYADVTQKIFTRAKGRWLHYQKYIEPHVSKLEPFIKAFGYE